MTTAIEHMTGDTKIRDNNVPRRLGPRWRARFMAVLGMPWQRRLAQAALQVDAIHERRRQWELAGDAELLAISTQLKSSARGAESLDRLLPEAFALVDAAVRRCLCIAPFDVQLAAGVILHGGGLVELATGEGKTLVAAFPAYLNALSGEGVHVVTVNE